MVAVSARPGGGDGAAKEEPVGLSELIEVLKSHSQQPQRDASGPFVFAVDHCFAIMGLVGPKACLATRTLSDPPPQKKNLPKNRPITCVWCGIGV